MSIKSGQMTGLLPLTNGLDNLIRQTGSGDTSEFYNLVVSETLGAAVTVDLFLSDDATSAPGERIEQVILSANETKAFQPVGVSKAKYLLAKPTTGGAVMHGEYIYRDGSDA